MQESPLSDRASIREALSFGMTPIAPDDELLDALAKAQLQYTLEVKSLGLDGKLAELSGGERQRVELARVILTRPRLAVLDEATSALDEITQKKVMEEIFKACGTVILTCHRPSVLRMCDRAIVLARGGRVVEDGFVGELSRDPDSRLQALMAERSPQVAHKVTVAPIADGLLSAVSGGV
ncbi:hypothetical protein FOZ63_017928 [Perkinsus olseni]|uniref:ABC transporter domain-containing protein n=1 Tax=Perkinsus olseni TaxID=32597 RepID=A0A7J6RK78_PEROL|nr:hypothetical protein FOZ63_017928 [Perkinsus olseni]